jgi:hypothetical protein
MKTCNKYGELSTKKFASGSDNSVCNQQAASALRCNAMCKDRYPWFGDGTTTGGVSGVLYGFVAVDSMWAFGKKERCGMCWELDFLNGKTAQVQETNLGTVNGIFDLAVPGGGFGDFNGCQDYYGWKVYIDQGGPCKVPGSPGGDDVKHECIRYGGLERQALCDSVFKDDKRAQKACNEVLFNPEIFPTQIYPDDKGPRFPDNAPIYRFKRIKCPTVLTAITGINNDPP